jgi:hypothetical protein
MIHALRANSASCGRRTFPSRFVSLADANETPAAQRDHALAASPLRDRCFWLCRGTIWEQVEPPQGTVCNYPIRPWDEQQPSVIASEASPDVAVQIYNRAIHNQMLTRLKED